MGARALPPVPGLQPSDHLLPARSDRRTRVPRLVAIGKITKNKLNLTNRGKSHTLAQQLDWQYLPRPHDQHLRREVWGPRRRWTHGTIHVSPGQVP